MSFVGSTGEGFRVLGGLLGGSLGGSLMAQTGSSRVQGEGRPCKNALGFYGGFVAFLLVRFRLGRLGFEGFRTFGALP